MPEYEHIFTDFLLSLVQSECVDKPVQNLTYNNIQLRAVGIQSATHATLHIRGRRHQFPCAQLQECSSSSRLFQLQQIFLAIKASLGVPCISFVDQFVYFYTNTELMFICQLIDGTRKDDLGGFLYGFVLSFAIARFQKINFLSHIYVGIVPP